MNPLKELLEQSSGDEEQYKDCVTCHQLANTIILYSAHFPFVITPIFAAQYPHGRTGWRQRLPLGRQGYCTIGKADPGG